MQTIRTILQIGQGGTALTDEFGSESGIQLEIMLGTACRLEFDLRGEPEKENSKLPAFPALDAGSTGWYFALDSKNANSSTPALLKYSGISLLQEAKGGNILAVELADNATAAILAALSGQESAVFRAEIGGLDREGTTVFAWQFDLIIRSRVFYGSGEENIFNDPAYYTAAQIEAMLNARDADIVNALSADISKQVAAGTQNPTEFQFSLDGVADWHETQTAEDRFFRQRIANLDAAWSDAIMLITGTPGKDGANGADGYTPVRGTDYWTESDKAEIKAYVDNSILNGAW